MKFSHLVEINDPLNPLIDPLTREQLWRGLVARAEMPEQFIPWLDQCTLGERSEYTVERALRFGEVLIRDRVTFLPQHQVQYHVPPQRDIPASSLTMTIEEPQPAVLFVRFEYDDGLPASPSGPEALYDQFRRSAYQEADIDTIRIIRQMVEEGRLGSRN